MERKKHVNKTKHYLLLIRWGGQLSGQLGELLRWCLYVTLISVTLPAAQHLDL